MTDQSTYSYDGMIGSLDHVLGNAAGMELVVDAAVWNVNAYESVALEYSRYNYNVAPLFNEAAFPSSDHDPLVVGLDLWEEVEDLGAGDSDGEDPEEPSDGQDPGNGDTDADGDGADDSDGGSDLPATGANVAPLIAGAGLLFIGGLALMLRRRGMQE